MSASVGLHSNPQSRKGPGAEDAEADESPRKMIMNTGTSVWRQQTISQLHSAYAQLHQNQAHVAHEFAADHNGHLLNVRNMGWRAWDGTRWVPDTGMTQRALLQTLRRLRASGQAMATEAIVTANSALSKKSDDLLKLVRSCESAGGLAGVLTIASNLEGMMATVDQLDADGYLLNMPNGTLDLHTRQLQAHDPANLITKITRGSFDPAAPAESKLWDEFLDTVLPDTTVLSFFRRIIGLALVGAVLEHIFTIATGSGRNGKGVAYGAVMHALGDYAAVAEEGLFEVQRGGNAQGASPGLAKLRGVRFLVASELDERARIAAAFMKRMTGGDPITARELYGAPFEFKPAFLILMITNFLPKLPANDPATWARVRVIEFGVKIPKNDQDPQLGSKLEGSADAVLAWAVAGLADYQANGLGEPAKVELATQAYAESQDDVRRFIDARCTDTPSNDGDTTSELISAYQSWAADEGIHSAHVLGRTKFGEALDKLGYLAKKTNRGAVRTGLGVDREAA
ncbi:phage/plasmid primase, P4 family [Cryobacterium sp. 5B3]|uniref:DNA primase family protein n=1 Tax=Cryobacterium sp. 5B3 TaxID=3048586 RepID=UPI002AB3BFCD|nr:phage/plasmid primase, P4 family [Cryobacterium sp. 5B3]MDY7541771.1 phage/plasmid primase, P4 family [Cryobacterium sp. 5B3]MEB0275249.1 phage/plasmid primase, P4 family [Cryobacterium sp. 5B3]